MIWTNANQHFNAALEAIARAAASPETYWQLALALLLVWLSWLLKRRVLSRPPSSPALAAAWNRASGLIPPLVSILLLSIGMAGARMLLGEDWLLRGALIIALLVLVERVIDLSEPGPLVAAALRFIGIPLLTLHLLDLLAPITSVLDAMSLQVGNLKLTVSGLLRIILFGSLLFWIGWVCNSAGQNLIRRQERLDLRMREVMAKLFQIGVFVLVALLFLQVMGINLTALAVFGGAVGVGLGFGLQSIASNFISGIIILFDRSLSVGDYVEMEEGLKGYVRELNMRYTTLETFDGKSVLVPNEKFISSPFNNWTHKNRKQRYRVDFSVAYSTDIRALCELVRTAVAAHPQVISGDHIPIEERPDCEIDSFGDNGVNMFVEFWMEGVDDGPNRVGGDLMLIIFETLRAHNIEIPFPQREVRMLNT